MAEPQANKHVLAPKDGQTIAVAHPRITEKEIYDDRQIIIQRLHASYMAVSSAMRPMQEQWDASPMLALLNATKDGATAGISAWGDDFADYFKAETWTDLGGKIKNAAGTAYDSLADNAASQYKQFVTEVNQASKKLDHIIDNPDKTVANWGWWQANIQQVIDQHVNGVQGTVGTISKEAAAAAAMAKKIYKHRDAILDLPNLIARGDPKPIQRFVDTVLKDIDPELAKSIKNDPNFYVVLEIIADHESVLAYLAYAGLIFEAVPPNFYAYMAAKGAAYLVVEIVLLVITAILSAGAAAAARIASLAARLAMSSAKIAKVAKKAQQIVKACDALTDSLEDFSRASQELHQLGAKLNQARQRGVTLKGNTRSTLSARRESIKRDKKCRICGSTKHTTPHGRLGTVEYE